MKLPQKTDTQRAAVDHERLVLCLFEARRDAKNALKLWQEKAAEIGRCAGCDEEEGACYLQRNPDLCDVCAAKQPFWEARQKASIAAGVALRRVLNAGKFLSENAKGEARADNATPNQNQTL